MAECRSGVLDGVVAAYRTTASISITGLIDAELVDVLPNSLKFLCHSISPSTLLPAPSVQAADWAVDGAGYDQVHVEACTARGIRVSNTPTAVDDATADVNVFLLIGALRGFNRGIVGLRRGEWLNDVPLGHDPQGKVLGILGMGGIGRALKRRTDVLEMRTIYHNRRRLDPALEDGAEYVTFDELLAGSDVISLNLPLNVSARQTVGLEGGGVAAKLGKKLGIGQYAAHHQHQRVRKDERRCSDCEYGARGRDG